MEIQVYNGGNDSPVDLGLKPDNQELPALYYNNAGTAVWGWMRSTRTWVRYSQTVDEQVFGGAGFPTTPPPNPDKAAIYVDWETGVVNYWRKDNHTWN